MAARYRPRRVRDFAAGVQGALDAHEGEKEERRSPADRRHRRHARPVQVRRLHGEQAHGHEQDERRDLDDGERGRQPHARTHPADVDDGEQRVNRREKEPRSPAPPATRVVTVSTSRFATAAFGYRPSWRPRGVCRRCRRRPGRTTRSHSRRARPGWRRGSPLPRSRARRGRRARRRPGTRARRRGRASRPQYRGVRRCLIRRCS